MSLSKSEQARINGAKSRGPKTPEGKAVSSMNSLKHGRRANSLPRAPNGPAFQQLLGACSTQFAPRSAVEAAFLHQYASADWQLDRWRAIETAFLNRLQARLCPPEVDPDPCSTLAAAFDISVNESRLFAYFLRRISKSSAERNRAFRDLRQHRKSSLQSATPPQPAPPTVNPADFFVFASTFQNHFKVAEAKPVMSPGVMTSEPKTDPAIPAAAEPRLACRAAAAGHIFDFLVEPEFRPQSTDSKPVIELHPIPDEPNSNPPSPPSFIVEPNVPSHPSRQPRCLQRPDRGPDRVLSARGHGGPPNRPPCPSALGTVPNVP